MAQDPNHSPTDQEVQEIPAEMAEYGISCIPLDNFYYREFHYTNLRDAIAQAKRDRVRLGLIPDA